MSMNHRLPRGDGVRQPGRRVPLARRPGSVSHVIKRKETYRGDTLTVHGHVVEVSREIYQAVTRAAADRKQTVNEFIERNVPREPNDSMKKILRRILARYLPDGYFDQVPK